jgi:hypothetical protein
MKQLTHNNVMSECNMLQQIAVAPPSVCFKYVLIFLFGLAILASKTKDSLKATVTCTLKIFNILHLLLPFLIIVLFLLSVPYHYHYNYHL